MWNVVCILTLSVVFAGSCYAPAWGQETSAVTLPQSSEFGFYRYLRSQNPQASLVAFNPSRYDPRPEYRRIPSRASIRADLKILRRAFDGLVLYGFDAGITPNILAEAKRNRFRAVLLGIWDPTSTGEIDQVAALVKKYHNLIALAVCVGNEGLQFGRYTRSDLISATDRLRQALGSDVHIPITTSEPLAQYTQVTLTEYGDFLAPNIHPVFDHPQLGAVDAVVWVRDQARALSQISGKPVLVKETGFPHGGDPRFTPATQEAFWAAYLDGLRLVSFPDRPSLWISHAVAFEAFDLPWKAVQSNLPIEEAWGLLNTKRKPYPAFFVWETRR